MATQQIKDILDTEIPRPTWSLRPSVETPIRSDIDFSRPDKGNPDPTAQFLDPSSGQYIGKGKDTPFINGPSQALFINSGATTELSEYSTDFQQWSESGATLGVRQSPAIDSGDAFVVQANGSTGDRIKYVLNTTFSTSRESIKVIMEDRGSGADTSTFIDAIDNDNGGIVARCEFNVGTGNVFGTFGDANTIAGYSRKLPIKPNGNDTWGVVLRFNADGSDPHSGSSVRLDFRPDNGGSTNVILHYYGYRQKQSFGNPIVTNTGSTTERGRDNAYINVSSDWFNPNEGTWVFEMSPHMWQKEGGMFWDGGNANMFLGGSHPNHTWRYNDGSNIPQEQGGGSFEFTRAVYSITETEVRLAVNGSGNIYGHNGNLLNVGSEIELGRRGDRAGGGGVYAFNQVTYLPQAISLNDAEILSTT